MMTVYRSSQLISGITVLVASLVAFQTNDVDAAPLHVHVSFDHEESFEVQNEWRSKRSITYDEDIGDEVVEDEITDNETGTEEDNDKVTDDVTSNEVADNEVTSDEVAAGNKVKMVKRWSADALAGKEEVKYEEPKEATTEESKDYEVVDLTNKGGLINEPLKKKFRGMLLVPLCALGVLVVVVIYWQLCLNRRIFTCWCDLIPCLYCLHPKRLGRAAVSKYMPGVIVHPDGETEYYELSEGEVDALHEVADTLM